MIARAGNETRPAHPRIHHFHLEMKAREINRRRQPRRSAADDEAVIIGFAHARLARPKRVGSGADCRSGRCMTWRASILTLYPEMFPGPLGQSPAARALAEGPWYARKSVG